MLDKIKKNFLFVLKAIKQYSLKTSAYRIEEIDLKNKKVVISRRGMNTILKLSLMDVLHDSSLISNLPSDQACWLGYYCGRISRDSTLNVNNFSALENSEQFTLITKKGKYKILSLDRKKNIIYHNLSENSTITESPLDIINNTNLINQFDPSQACYIGILAGLLTPKQIQAITAPVYDKPFLRVVK